MPLESSATMAPIDEEAVFQVARQIGRADARQLYLDQVCGEPRLRARLDALLRAFDRGPGILGRPPGWVIRPPGSERGGPVADTPDTDTGDGAEVHAIGPYTLREQIGEGGMGLVFRAEQDRPVRRQVALKVLKPGMDTRQVVARFAAERQALALMDHPHIARVFDAGTTPEGRPYFVMELVKGVPVTDYCARHRLPVRERLALFEDVCRAVQHAHQKGVIHRDIKPSNVLVVEVDGKPVPKVIDFGIAKAVAGPSLADSSVVTHHAQLVGTPLYMAPEQAEPGAADVDTRADVYSLGVVLYELLTGTTPFDANVLQRAGVDGLRRILREEEPARPSDRLSTLAAAARSTASGCRRVDARQLPRQLRGELDWVVMRCLEKDRDRRYQSAGALAADVERYLADEPVEACPPSAAYRLRTFWRRNYRVLVPAGVVAVTLVAATAVSMWQAVQARDAQHQAEVAEGRAETEAAIARAVSDFLRYDLLRQVDKGEDEDWWTEHPNLTVREAIDRAAGRIGDRFRDQPLVEAAIRTTIGDAYQGVGDGPPAVAHLERALALRRDELGPDHPDTLDTMHRLARAYESSTRWSDAIALRERILETSRSVLGGADPASLKAMTRLAGAYQRAGQFDKALELSEQVLAARTASLGPTHLETLKSMSALAGNLFLLRRFDESLALAQQTLEACQANLGPDHRFTIDVMCNCADASWIIGKVDEAERLEREVLRYHQKQRGTRAAGDTAHTMAKLSAFLLRRGQFAEAESWARQAQKTYETTPIVYSGPDDWRTFYAMTLAGAAVLGQGRAAEAEPLLAKGYDGMKQRAGLIGGPARVWVPASLEPVVRAYEAAARPEKARAWRERLAPELWAKHGPP